MTIDDKLKQCEEAFMRMPRERRILQALILIEGIDAILKMHAVDPEGTKKRVLVDLPELMKANL